MITFLYYAICFPQYSQLNKFQEFSLTDTTSRGHFSAKIAAKDFLMNKMYQFLFVSYDNYVQISE